MESTQTILYRCCCQNSLHRRFQESLLRSPLPLAHKLQVAGQIMHSYDVLGAPAARACIYIVSTSACAMSARGSAREVCAIPQAVVTAELANCLYHWLQRGVRRKRGGTLRVPRWRRQPCCAPCTWSWPA